MGKQGQQGMVYGGVTHINLDAKARLAVPTRYRTQLEQHCLSQLCVTAAFNDRCLLMYPLPEWEKLAKKLSNMPTMFDGLARQVNRVLMSYAEERQLDGQGRLLLTASQKEYAGITKSIVLAGQGNRFEIWDEESWNQKHQDFLANGFGEIDVDSLSEHLRNL